MQTVDDRKSAEEEEREGGDQFRGITEDTGEDRVGKCARNERTQSTRRRFQMSTTGKVQKEKREREKDRVVQKGRKMNERTRKDDDVVSKLLDVSTYGVVLVLSGPSREQ
ncbi:hypothetical protein Adt_02408 [Abeliophyllum distichum]|uniref:Uncharacterized protein n=1 Tax=Abeliophyllum distichum TaxID=126358 RepID=A0ABD1VYV0_9LAMI